MINDIVDVVLDHVPTDSGECHPSPNHKRRDNSMEIDDEAHMRSPNNKKPFSENCEFDASDTKVTEPWVALPTKIKACFFLFFSGFVILYLIFFLVVAYTYPLKPEVYSQRMYLPVLDKISPNITQEMKESIFFQLRFDNRNKLISVSYDDFLNISLYYKPNSTTKIYFANTTLPGFYQHKVKPVTKVVQITAPGIADLIKLREEFTTVYIRVLIKFNMRYHCRELGKHKHRFRMKANFEVPLETGSSFEDSIWMYEVSS